MLSALKILFIASRFPYPPIQGDRLRAYHQIRMLARHHRITLLAPVLDGGEARQRMAVGPMCERVIPVPIRRAERARNLLRAPFSALPLQTTYWYHARIAREVHAACLREKFDLAHVQLVRMAPAAAALDRIPRVLDFTDALSLSFSRRARRERFPMDQLCRWEARRLRRYEAILIERFDATLVIAEADRKALGGSPKIHLCRNGVSLDAPAVPEQHRERRTIVFSGRMSAFPNADAAVWFATHVFPIVRSRIGDARLRIVGAYPPRRVKKLATLPGVEITGRIPDLGEAVSRAAVAVAPLLTGAGTQNKVLEAMALGVPVVATRMVADGVAAAAGEHLLVADEPEPFAEAVISLMAGGQRQRIIDNARRFVEREYSWNRAAGDLERAYEFAMRTHASGSVVAPQPELRMVNA
jgi:sugar transferase (PEP-CTERM/EpsH1 system associated)